MCSVRMRGQAADTCGSRLQVADAACWQLQAHMLHPHVRLLHPSISVISWHVMNALPCSHTHAGMLSRIVALRRSLADSAGGSSSGGEGEDKVYPLKLIIMSATLRWVDGLI